MKAIDVLRRIDRADHRVAVERRRQRQLHEDAVDGGIRVELCDERHQLGLRRGGRQLVIANVDVRLARRLRLAAHVDGRCRIVADEHDRERRRDVVIRAQRGRTASRPRREPSRRSPCRRSAERSRRAARRARATAARPPTLARRRSGSLLSARRPPHELVGRFAVARHRRAAISAPVGGALVRADRGRHGRAAASSRRRRRVSRSRRGPCTNRYL